MKKLMIAAAVALTATFANAAAYCWGFGSASDEEPGQSGTYLDGGTAMLFLGTIAQTSTGEGSGVDAKYNLDFSGLTHIATAGQDAGTYDFGVTSFDASTVPSSDDITLTPQAYTLVLFKDNDVVDYENYEGYYYAYTSTSIKSQDPATGTDYADLTTADPVLSDMWRTAEVASSGPDPIPEPTSGLLLLLGMAGLALKRKRA